MHVSSPGNNVTGYHNLGAGLVMRGTNYSMLSGSSGNLSGASTADEDPSPTKSRYQRSCAPSLSPVRDNSGDLSVGKCCNVQISPSEALARLSDMDAAIRASGLQHRLRRSEGRSEPPAQGKRKGAQITADALEKLRGAPCTGRATAAATSSRT